jgi:hypothetical protein
MNDKTSPDQMRVLLRRMRGEKYVVGESKEPKKDVNMRDMLKITRKLNEQAGDEAGGEKKSLNKKNVYDQQREEDRFKAFFDDMNVSIKFIELEVYDDFVFWGGTVDGVIQFVYKVTPEENTSGVEFNYLDEFSPDNPDNDVIIKKIETYFDTVFYKYWRDNIIDSGESSATEEKPVEKQGNVVRMLPQQQSLRMAAESVEKKNLNEEYNDPESGKPEEPKADYSELIKNVKRITPAFLNSTANSLGRNFPKYMKEVEDDGWGKDVGGARSRMVRDFVYAIVEKAGLLPVQYDWKNSKKNTLEDPLDYFQIYLWANTPDGDTVNTIAYISVNDRNVIDWTNSEVKAVDENWDDIVDMVAKTDYETRRASMAQLKAKQYQRFLANKDNIYWYHFFDDFNKGINKLLDKYPGVGTDEESAKMLIASAFMLQICKLLKITPLPKLSDFKTRHSYWSYYESEIELPDYKKISARMYIAGKQKGEYEIYKHETEVVVIDQGVHTILAKNKT